MEIYVVLATSLIVWIALFAYIARVDARLKDLENRE
ncbi:MAG: CcmD family protein [Armatimonadota bacterium]